MSTSQNRPPPKTLLVSESFWSKRTNAIFKTAKQTKASVSAQTRQVNGWTQRVNIKRRRRSRTLHEELWSRIFSSTVYYTQPSCLFRLLPDISCKIIQICYIHVNIYNIHIRICICVYKLTLISIKSMHLHFYCDWLPNCKYSVPPLFLTTLLGHSWILNSRMWRGVQTTF